MRLVVDSNVVFTIIIAGDKSKAFRIIKDLEFKKHKDKMQIHW